MFTRKDPDPRAHTVVRFQASNLYKGERSGPPRLQFTTMPHCVWPCPVGRFCHHGIHVWAIRGDHRSGAAGREDPGHRRGDVGAEGLRRAQLQRRTDHHDQHGGQTPQRARRRVDAPGAADAVGAGAAVGQGGRGRCSGHQGPAADQRTRREGHQLSGVPQFGEGQALPGADGRLVRVAAQRRNSLGQEGAEDAVLHVRRRRRAAVHGGAVVDVAAQKCGQGQPAAAELHDHHHRRGRSAGRDPRPDAADDQRSATGTAGSTPTRPSTRDCCADTATSTGSRFARCRGWSTASATTGPS